MDIYRILYELQAEWEKVDSAIKTLERLQSGGTLAAPKSKRGRKTMSEEERRRVSERMKRYWEQRRGPMGS